MSVLPLWYVILITLRQPPQDALVIVQKSPAALVHKERELVLDVLWQRSHDRPDE